jgi:hypothetical protein
LTSKTTKTLGADKGYDCADFVAALRAMEVTPHVAAKAKGSAIDGRTTRQEGYAMSQRKRKRIAEPFGWGPYERRPVDELSALVDSTEKDGTIRLSVQSDTRAGNEVEKLARLTLRTSGTTEQRLQATGLLLGKEDDRGVVRGTKLGSEAAKYGLKTGDEILAVMVPARRPSPYWFALPALALLGLIWALQLRRRSSTA